jgi:glycosyltransferase involved in cell wall biosynthesis
MNENEYNNKNAILVSIGIPVYNVEPYIEKCLLSVLNQTYSDLEILIVDDCGKDNSISIVESIKNSHPRGNQIRILKQPYNKGLGEARNMAIQYAKGKYLYFLDSDDYIELNTIEIMVNYAEKYHTDVVNASPRIVLYETGEVLPAFTYPSFKMIKGKDEFSKFVCQDLKWHIGVASWNNLFLMSFLIQNNLFFSARKDEDALFLSDYYSEVECAVLLPNITYNYVSRPDSIMGYMGRNQIPIREIRERFRTDAVMTNHCVRLKGRTFYDVHCARVVKHKFRAVCVALRHRHRFTEPLSSKEIRQELKHPATMAEILKFKRYKTFHILFYMISVLPSFLSVGISYVIGKMMKWI